jgi:hypothetical protein
VTASPAGRAMLKALTKKTIYEVQFQIVTEASVGNKNNWGNKVTFEPRWEVEVLDEGTLKFLMEPPKKQSTELAIELKKFGLNLGSIPLDSFHAELLTSRQPAAVYAAVRWWAFELFASQNGRHDFECKLSVPTPASRDVTIVYFVGPYETGKSDPSKAGKKKRARHFLTYEGMRTLTQSKAYI